MSKQNLNHELDAEAASFVAFLERIPLTSSSATKDQLLYQCGMSAAQAGHRRTRVRSRWLTIVLVCAAATCGVWTGRLSFQPTQSLVVEQSATDPPALQVAARPTEFGAQRSANVLLASMSMEQMQEVLANEKQTPGRWLNPDKSTSRKTWSAGMSTRELELSLLL